MGQGDQSDQSAAPVRQRLVALSELQQPTAALQSTCRAVFCTDTATLSTLYDEAKQCIELATAAAGGGGLALALVASTAAYTILLDGTLASEMVLRQFVQDVFLPLAALGDAAQAGQQLQQLSGLLAAKQSWQVALEVLQCAHMSLQLVLQRDDCGVAHAVTCGSVSQALSKLHLVQVQLQPAIGCAVISQLVAAASQEAQQLQHSGLQQAINTGGSMQLDASLQSVLQLAAGPLLSTALQLLQCHDSSMRQSAFQQLLPDLLQAAAAVGPAQRQSCLDQLMQQCLDMMSRPAVPRRMGLAVLLQYASHWQLQPPTAGMHDPAPSSINHPQTEAATADSNQRFWQLLRACLVDPEPLNRKRALRLLQLLLPKAQLQAEPAWGIWIALYELLDEFTPHLVKATWPMISHLHRVADAFAEEDAAGDVATSSNLNVLGKGQPAAQPADKQQQTPMAFSWSSIIWTRALQHSNLQVQRMALKTLLKRDWSPSILQQVPVEFLKQVLLPALLSPLHYNSQVAVNPTTTGAVLDPHKQQTGSTSTFDVAQQACQLVSSYVLCAGPAAARELFTGGLQAATAPSLEVSRAGMQAVLRALAGAGNKCQQHGQGLLHGLTAAEEGAYAEDSLLHLQLVLARCQATWRDNNIKAACAKLVFNIAAAVAPPSSCSLAACARLLQDVPLWMLTPGGTLQVAAAAWLVGSDSAWLEQAASNMWQDYLYGTTTSSTSEPGQHSVTAPSSQQWPDGMVIKCYATSSEYALWHVASGAWLRVVMCCGDNVQQLVAAAAQELAHCADVSVNRPYLPEGLPDRVLIMAYQLLDTAAAACSSASQQSGSGRSAALLPLVTQAAVQFAAGPGGAALMQLLRLHCSCFRSSPAELVGDLPSNRQSAAAAGIGFVLSPAAAGAGFVVSPVAAGAGFVLCPAAWQATARAESTAAAAAAAAVLLAQYLAALQQDRVSAAAGLSVRQACVSLQQLLGHMAEVGQALADKPLPGVSVQGAAGDSQLSRAAAAAELSRASAIKVLRHLAQGMSRALGCLPQQQWPPHGSLPLQPSSWVGALLRETAAAAAAATHREPLLAAATHREPLLAAACATGDVSGGWIKGIDWECLDSCMALTGLLCSPTAAADGTQQQPAAAANGTAGAAAACLDQLSGSWASRCGAERLPAGVLQQGVLVSVLVEALEALQWTAPDALLHLLRCVRRVWALAVHDEDLQVAALKALSEVGLDAPNTCGMDDSTPAGQLVALAASLGRSLLQVLQGTKKRPMVLCGTLINTLMLPELMLFNPQQHPTFVSLHAGPDAPLRRFVAGLLQPGARASKGSPALHVVVALRLGACTPSAPQLLGWYADELRHLLQFGGTMEAGLETKSALGHEASTEWSLLAEPLEPHIATAGVIAGMGPRIAVVTALHQLAVSAGLFQPPVQLQGPPSKQHAGSQGCNGHSAGAESESGISFKAAAVAAGVRLWHRWMQAVKSDPVLSAENFKYGTDMHRVKVRMWQGLSALAAFLGCPTQQGAATEAVKELLCALESTNPPSVKQYQESILTFLLWKHQHLIQELLLPLLLDLSKGGAATASHVLIAVQACLHSSQQEQLMPLLVLHLLPWTNHHTHNIRTFAQLGFCALLEAKPLDSWPAWQQGLGQGGIEMVQALRRFYDGNLDFQRFRRNMGAGMMTWSPGSVVTPAGIFCTALSLAGAEEGFVVVTFEGCNQSLMDTVLHFLAEERAKLREAAAEKEAADTAAGTAVLAPGHGIDAASGDGAVGGLQLDYQRKVTPSERAVLLADVLDDVDEAVQGGAQSGPAGTRRRELVIVASLIDKVPNLAGLARTAEVLGVGTLVLSDLRVANDQLFTSISVTAERWVPLLEVKEAALLGWLRQQKAAGYSLVGLEQTAESTQLPCFAFPTKTVLVLGREKEGIPPEIITLLDATVEIPQLGVIRSLNVHVSGAIAMYEYTKQQLQAQGVNKGSGC